MVAKVRAVNTHTSTPATTSTASTASMSTSASTSALGVASVNGGNGGGGVYRYRNEVLVRTSVPRTVPVTDPVTGGVAEVSWGAIPKKHSHIQVIKVGCETLVSDDRVLYHYATATEAIYNTLLFLSIRAYEVRNPDRAVIAEAKRAEWKTKIAERTHIKLTADKKRNEKKSRGWKRNARRKRNQPVKMREQSRMSSEDVATCVELFPASLSAESLATYARAVSPVAFPWIDELPSQVVECASRNLASAYTAFFDGRSKYPKFKHHRNTHGNVGNASGRLSVTLRRNKPDDPTFAVDPHTGDVHVAVVMPLVRKKREFGLSKNQLVWVRLGKDQRVCRAMERIRKGYAQVQEVTFSLTYGRWSVSIRLRVADGYQRQYRPTVPDFPQQHGKVGIDVAFGDRFIVLSKPVPGLTDSDGVVEAPRWLIKNLGRLEELQRQLARTEPTSRHRMRLLKRIRGIHFTIAAERGRWQHHISNIIATVFDVIVVETLNIAALAKRKKGGKYSYGKVIADHAPGQFLEVLEQKTTRYRKEFIPANTWFPSSKLCSGCGAKKKKMPVWVRQYECGVCGLVLDRDVNAARNLETYPKDWTPPAHTAKKHRTKSNTKNKNSNEKDSNEKDSSTAAQIVQQQVAVQQQVVVDVHAIPEHPPNHTTSGMTVAGAGGSDTGWDGITRVSNASTLTTPDSPTLYEVVSMDAVGVTGERSYVRPPHTPHPASPTTRGNTPGVMCTAVTTPQTHATCVPMRRN